MFISQFSRYNLPTLNYPVVAAAHADIVFCIQHIHILLGSDCDQRMENRPRAQAFVLAPAPLITTAALK